MDEQRKRSLTVGLILLLGISPLLFERYQDCYDNVNDCSRDWNSSDCSKNYSPTANQCHYLGRPHNYFFRNSPYGSNHSTISVTRGGFGSIGHGFHGGS